MTTILGGVRLERTIQQCDRCRKWRVPQDIVLDVEKTGFSPGLRRMMAKCGGEVCFDKARDFIRELAGVRVTDKEVERVAEAVGRDIAEREDEKVRAAMEGSCARPRECPPVLYVAADGTGVPVLRRETEGRKGKAEDGVARTREVKLGAVFTQSSLDEEGNPVRDPASTTYVGRIERADEFGPRLYAEARERGAPHAQRLVVIGDGAPWIWNLSDEHFPGAVQVLDYYHAKEHLCELAKALYPTDQQAKDHWLKPLTQKLRQGRIHSIISELKSLKLPAKKKAEAIRVAAYLEKNKQRMRYRQFRKQGFFIGSGVIEAGCKSLIGQRLKQSGMHWSVRGSNAIIALRCCIESARFEDYWEQRQNAA